MLTIQINEDELIEALEQVAKRKDTTVTEVARDALRHYVQSEETLVKGYSFIGIGHSGSGNLSQRVEETLAENANRKEGWSLAE